MSTPELPTGDVVQLPAVGKLAVAQRYYDELFSSQTGTQCPARAKITDMPGFQSGGTLIVPPDAPLQPCGSLAPCEICIRRSGHPIFGPNNALPACEQLTLSAEGAGYEVQRLLAARSNPKFGFMWKPLRVLTVHGSWGTSFNGPSPCGFTKADIIDLFILPEFPLVDRHLLAASGGK